MPGSAGARAFIESFLAEALPTDAPGRAFHLVWISYAVLAMSDPELAAQPFVAGPDRLERRLADVLQQAQGSGTLSPHRDAALEAAHLLTLSHGLGTSVLVDQRSAEAVLRDHLDRLFSDEPAGRASARRASSGPASAAR